MIMTVEGGQAMTDVAVRFEDVSVFLVVGGWIVVYFANGGVTSSLMIILSADILIAGLLALNLARAGQ